MKLKHVVLKRQGVGAATLLVFVSCAVSALAAASSSKPESNPSSKEPQIPKSVFIDDYKLGKDPFFPNSVRRGQKPPDRPTPSGSTAIAPEPVQLTLRAISIGQTKRLATINSRVVAIDEEADVLVGTQKVKIRCLEIRDASVLVRIEGVNEPKELFLRQR